MYKQIKVWHKIRPDLLAIFNCYEDLESKKFTVFNADYYKSPIDYTTSTNPILLEADFFIGADLEDHEWSDTLKEAIALFEKGSADMSNF